MENKKDIGIIVVLFLLFIFVGYSCPFRLILGIPCPGCNMTTSLIYFLHGDLYTSIYYHALLLPTGIVFVLCILFYKNTLNYL